MTDAEIIDLTREAIWITIKLGTPVMMVGLFVGVVVALLQALTQVQEMTLVFVPKMIAMYVAMMIGLPFMTVALIDFMHELADKIIAGG